MVVGVGWLAHWRDSLRTANWLFFHVARSPFTDATTGCKMFRRDLFQKFGLASRPIGWAFAFEMAIKAQHLGLRLGEVPLVSIDRLFGGKSSFRWGRGSPNTCAGSSGLTENLRQWRVASSAHPCARACFLPNLNWR